MVSGVSSGHGTPASAGQSSCTLLHLRTITHVHRALPRSGRQARGGSEAPSGNGWTEVGTE